MEVNEKIAIDHGLKKEEFKKIWFQQPNGLAQ